MATPMDPPPNLGGQAGGYPSRRTLPQPADNPGRYVAPTTNEPPFVPQLESAPPPRPSCPLPGEVNFAPGAIPGTSLHNANSRQESPVKG